ncbi:glycoside hydrolase family 57 protein [Candidatus Bathyarchaeota archaeon]|nr:glycoside hydrolase family 57 protein [Candidatus Bathyarchaeota archaeon]
MTDVCMIFEVHQPFRLNRNFPRDLLSNPSSEDLFKLYFDMNLNREIFNRIARECYSPANKIILELIEAFKDSNRKFKVSFSLSGVFLEQCELWNLQLLDSFKELVNTGCVELLCQTYYHSLASLLSESEFVEQVKMHRQRIREIFNYEPQVFENTECIYNNLVAKTAKKLGFRAVVTEGAERILGWRKPNYIYKAKNSGIPLLLRNYQLSDDIGFRFASKEWEEWPLTADKYACWLASTPGDVIVIFVDYETFGEHYRRESGIFDFLENLPKEVLKWRSLSFSTPSEAITKYKAVGVLDVAESETISWADLERDVSAWLGNILQKSLFNLLKEMEPLLKYVGDRKLIEIWRYLQTSDHLYYVSMKGGGSGDVHSTFNPYFSSVEAFMVFSRILSDFQARIHLRLERPELRRKRALRRLPPEKGFTFYYDFSRPSGLTACSLQEFCSILKTVDAKSIRFHMARGDFERWLLQVVGCRELAIEISKLRGIGDAELLRRKLLDAIERKIEELKREDG